MTIIKLSIVGIMYLWSAYDMYKTNQYGLMLVFLCYAISIVGLIIAGDKV